MIRSVGHSATARLLLLYSICALAPRPALADPGSMTDPEQARAVIEACLDTAEAEGRFGHRCEDAAMNACLEAPGGESVEGAIACAEAAEQAWDALRLRYFQTVEEGADKEMRALLTESQDAFIRYRDSACAAWSAATLGSKLGRQLETECRRAETARRALALRDLARIQ